MKNFRKVLALVLVVATLFSFTAMAGAYTDDKAITADYSEAVGVLSTLGILKGYEDGSFKPAATIDRDEMAKMIAVLANAGDDSVNALYAAQCNFADTATNWAKSYIGYCYNKGIISGRSATTFDPNGKVTGIETAKMLLVVLGFDAKEQGYTGVADSVWKVNVLRDAKNFGLLNNFAADFDVTKPITREQAAQMFMNALFCNIVVGTLSDNIIKISNAAYIHWDGLDWTLIDAAKYGLTVLYGNVLVSTTLLIDIFDMVNVEDTARTVDCHGRPAITWSFVDKYGKETSKTFVKSHLLAKAYTNGKPATVETDFKVYKDSKYYVNVYEDGALVLDGYLDDGTTFDAIDDIAAGNGVVVEVYVDEKLELVTVVVINTYIGTVGATDKKTGKVVLTAGSITVTLDKDENPGLAKDTKVLFWMCSDGRTVCLHDHSVVAAPAVTGAKINYSAYGPTVDLFKADGKTYEYAATFGSFLGGDKVDADDTYQASKKNMKNIYTDLNGYVMFVEDYVAPAPTVNYTIGYFLAGTNVYTLPTQIYADGSDNGYYTMDYVDFTGAKQDDVKIDPTIITKTSNRVTNKGFDGALLKVVDGKTLVWAETSKLAKSPAFVDAANGEIIPGELWADDNTKFLIKTPDGYKTVTGRKNLDKSYIADLTETDYIDLQYFAGDDKIADYVYIDAYYTAADEYFYVTGAPYAASWDEIYDLAEAYDVYTAIINGKAAAVAVAKGAGVLPTGLYKANLVMLGANAAELVDGTKAPLYVASDEIPAASDFGFKAAALGNGLVKIVRDDDSFFYEDLAAKYTVVDVIYKNSSFAAFKDVKFASNPAALEAYDSVNRVWCFLDANGDVELIIREVA